MANKFLLVVALVGASFLLTPALSHACDTEEHSTLEREKISLSDLNNAKTEADLYNFRTGHCTSLNNIQNGLRVSDLLPSDETTLGIFQYYSDKGDNKIEALKHTLEFNIHEQES